MTADRRTQIALATLVVATAALYLLNLSAPSGGHHYHGTVIGGSTVYRLT
jgi:hypothetical protein